MRTRLLKPTKNLSLSDPISLSIEPYFYLIPNTQTPLFSLVWLKEDPFNNQDWWGRFLGAQYYSWAKRMTVMFFNMLFVVIPQKRANR